MTKVLISPLFLFPFVILNSNHIMYFLLLSSLLFRPFYALYYITNLISRLIHKRAPTEEDVDEIALKHNILVGKWLVFVDSPRVDQMWSLIATATMEGRLGGSAKVSNRPQFFLISSACSPPRISYSLTLFARSVVPLSVVRAYPFPHYLPSLFGTLYLLSPSPLSLFLPLVN